jgi:hypothetical protein
VGEDFAKQKSVGTVPLTPNKASLKKNIYKFTKIQEVDLACNHSK